MDDTDYESLDRRDERQRLNNEQTAGDFNPTVGTKVNWMEKGEKVHGYIVEVRKNELVLKIHGRKGRFIVHKSQKAKAD